MGNSPSHSQSGPDKKQEPSHGSHDIGIMEMQRCSMHHNVLLIGEASVGFSALLSTILPSEHHNNRLLSSFHQGVLDLNVFTTALTFSELRQVTKAGKLDTSATTGLLIVVPADNTQTSAEDVSMYMELAQKLIDAREDLHIGVCYLQTDVEPVSEEKRGPEAQLPNAHITCLPIDEVINGDKKYDDVLRLVFHDVLTARYSKRDDKMRNRKTPASSSQPISLRPNLIKAKTASQESYVEHKSDEKAAPKSD